MKILQRAARKKQRITARHGDRIKPKILTYISFNNFSNFFAFDQKNRRCCIRIIYYYCVYRLNFEYKYSKMQLIVLQYFKALTVPHFADIAFSIMELN